MVVAVLARQLGIDPPGGFAEYCAGRRRWDHAVEIRQDQGYRDFSDPVAQFRLNRWLYAVCWTGTDRPSVLFDRATAWLITHKVLLPGVTVLERHVGTNPHSRPGAAMDIPDPGHFPGGKTQAGDASLRLPTVVTSPFSIVCERVRSGAARPNLPARCNAWRRYGVSALM